jgi:hypothetical protein
VRDSVKYPDDMVVISWMCSDGSRRAPIKIPKRVPFLKESKREGDRWGYGRVWKERDCLLDLATRGQFARRADGPAPRCGWSEITTRASSSTPRLCDPRGQSVGDPRMVRLVRLDGLPVCRWRSEILFLFSLRFFDIMIWIWIFWDHSSWLCLIPLNQS